VVEGRHVGIRAIIVTANSSGGGDLGQPACGTHLGIWHVSAEKDSLSGSAQYTLFDAAEAKKRVAGEDDEPTTTAAKSGESAGIGVANRVTEPVKGLRTRTKCGESLAARTRRPPVVLATRS